MKKGKRLAKVSSYQKIKAENGWLKLKVNDNFFAIHKLKQSLGLLPLGVIASDVLMGNEEALIFYARNLDDVKQLVKEIF